MQDSGQISAKVDYAYQDDMFFDPNNNPITIGPSYGLWNARMGWTSASARWEIAGWIKNIGDEDYIHHTFSQRGSRIAFARFGAPRNYGVPFTYNYFNRFYSLKAQPVAYLSPPLAAGCAFDPVLFTGQPQNGQISPQTTTTNSAPVARRISLIGTS